MNILLVGDVMLGRLVNDALVTKPPEYPWGDTLPLFKDAELRICNLECVIADDGTPWPDKIFHFRTDEKNIKTLLAADIGMVSLANNHILDFGYTAMDSCMNILGNNAINYAGVGKNNLEAAEPAICAVDSQNIGLIAFTDNEPDWEAQENKPGIFYVPIDEKNDRAQNLFRVIRQTRDDVDILIASAHWGPNWGDTPPQEHISFAHQLIDAGADIVFGHSSHVFRGIEIYKQKPILYSAGNFVDDYAVDEIERNDETFVFVIETDKKQIQHIKLYPTHINNFQTLLAQEREQEDIYAKMQELCEGLGTKTVWNSDKEYLEITL